MSDETLPQLSMQAQRDAALAAGPLREQVKQLERRLEVTEAACAEALRVPYEAREFLKNAGFGTLDDTLGEQVVRVVDAYCAKARQLRDMTDELTTTRRQLAECQAEVQVLQGKLDEVEIDLLETRERDVPSDD